jgi:tetratricopeptide (TPR) repeat protein
MRVLSCVNPLLVILLFAPPKSTFGQQLNGSAAASASDSLAAAHAKIQQGDAPAAIAILQALQASAPATKGLEHELGLAFYSSGELIKAEAAFAKAIEQDPNDKEAIQLRGLSLYRLGRPAAAVPYLEQVREWMPNGNADANYVLGLCYLNARRYDDARAAFAQQYGVPADSGPAYLLLGNMLLAANLPELALTAGQKALQFSPGLPLAHFMLGEVYLYNSNPDAALTEFSQEQKLNPGYAPIYDRLGDVYLRMGKLQQAQESLTRALSLDRSSTGPFIQMGKVFLKKGEFPNAAMYLQHAEKMDPGNYITHTLLGQAYRGLGRNEEAKQELDTAAKIHAAGELKLQPIQ